MAFSCRLASLSVAEVSSAVKVGMRGHTSVATLDADYDTSFDQDNYFDRRSVLCCQVSGIFRIIEIEQLFISLSTCSHI